MRFLTILKTMLPIQCRVTGNCTSGYQISVFIYLYVLFKSYHIEISPSTIKLSKSNVTTGTK